MSLQILQKKCEGKFITFHAMKLCGEVELWLHSFLSFALNQGDSQLQTLAASPSEKNPLVPINWEKLGDAGADSETLGKTEIKSPKDNYFWEIDLIIIIMFQT